MAYKQAMVLAAGLGTRLKPFSLIRPKPLFPVLDVPLLCRTIKQLQNAGFHLITVNAHHLKEQIARQLENESDIILQLEDNILGTGGGMRLASEHFGKEPVLVINGDIFHDINLHEIYKQHCSSNAEVTLVMHDLARFNNVWVDGRERIKAFGSECPIREDDWCQLAFTGIHVVNPEVLKSMPLLEFYDIIDCYRECMKKGIPIKANVVRNHFWTDMGTPADYLKLHEHLLSLPTATSRIHLGEDVIMGPNASLDDWVSIGSHAEIGRKAKLTRVVVWDGVKVKPGAVLTDVIVA